MEETATMVDSLVLLQTVASTTLPGPLPVNSSVRSGGISYPSFPCCYSPGSCLVACNPTHEAKILPLYKRQQATTKEGSAFVYSCVDRFLHCFKTTVSLVRLFLGISPSLIPHILGGGHLRYFV